MNVHLADRWILDRYMRMLARALRAARAHARYSHQFVVDRLTEGVELQRPDPQRVDECEVRAYLLSIGQTIVDVRYKCNDLFDADGSLYALVQSDQPGSGLAVSPGCEAALSLLDAIDDNVPKLLLNWGQPFWCRPRCLYDRLRRHEIEFESGLARFTGFLQPVDKLAPSAWACDQETA